MEDLYSQADLYCQAFDYPVDAEVAYALQVVTDLMGRRPTSVLEPMCGNARYGPVFTTQGLRYVGFDLSPEMLGRIPADAGLTTCVADASNFDIDGVPFDLGFCPINSIRHLPDSDALEGNLRCMHRHLVPGGFYWIETSLFDWDGTIEGDGANWSMPQPDGSEVKAAWWCVDADRSRGMMQEACRFERVVDGRVTEFVEEEFDMLMTSSSDWNGLAARTGFEVVGVHTHKADRWIPGLLTSELDNSDDNHGILLRSKAE
ncbi:MAG: class I SAM-dependent methyltransferase [Phycisphaerales bacterium]|nr:class I SAM-dependent methyltransferase [Phycisphaerales bacterium]